MAVGGTQVKRRVAMGVHRGWGRAPCQKNLARLLVAVPGRKMQRCAAYTHTHCVI